MTREPLPLATIQTAVLEFLRDRDDVVLFGAQAVNAYVGEPRMTQDIDLLSTRAEAQPKAGTDWRDLAMLLLTFPDLKCDSGPVRDCLQTSRTDGAILAVWQDLVSQEIRLADEEDEFY